MQASVFPIVKEPERRRLDAVDVRMLGILRRNGRINQESLAQELSLSRPAVRERLRRLEASGAIERYTIELNWPMLDYPILAFVWIRTTASDMNSYARDILNRSTNDAFVEECHRVTGDWCFLAKLRAKSSLALESLLDSIRNLPNAAATSTTLALSTARHSHDRA